MENRQNWYIKLIVLHLVLGIAMYLLKKPLSYVYGILILFVGLLYVIRTKNKNNEVLIVIGYIVGSEVFLRMTYGNLLHDIAKYEVVFFSLLGMIYNGFSSKSFIFALCVLLLIPGVILGMTTLGFSINIRKAITFNLLGPITLLIASMYCYKRVISHNTLKAILLAISLPIVSVILYLFLYTPSTDNIFRSTQSNFVTSGGFGPNQVSTVLGLGMFTFFTLFLFYSKTKIEVVINSCFFILATYRGIITFSRGGVFTSIGMILSLLFLITYYSRSYVKSKIFKILGAVLFGVIAIWFYSIYQTNGLIVNRYANQDAIGRVKEDRLGGREEIALGEWEFFKENPLFGIGVGKSMEEREIRTNETAASHSEITRMPAEHGILGIIILLLLIFTSLIHYSRNRNYLMSLPFFIFWLLTINHAAMRLAAPAAIYALSLLQLTKNEEKTNSLFRE